MKLILTIALLTFLALMTLPEHALIIQLLAAILILTRSFYEVQH